jgi:hypothetical protein
VAHIDTRAFRPESVDRAQPRAAQTWRALAIAAVAMCIAPALLIGALVLVEALIPPTRQFTERPPVRPQPWRAGVQRPPKITIACALVEPAPCAQD